MKNKSPTLIDQLRKAVEQSDLTRYEIAKRTGIDNAALSRFVHGERGLSMEAIDALGECLGLRIVQMAKSRARKGR